MSDFNPIELKFSTKFEFDVLNNLPMFGYDQLISGLALTRAKCLCWFVFVIFVVVCLCDL